MTQWFHDPFARTEIRGSHSASATALSIVSGEGSRFTDAPRQLVLWDASLWDDWVPAFYGENSPVEIIHQLTPASSNQLPSVLRAREGTTALDMTDTTKRFRIQAVQTGFIVATDINTGTISVTAGDLTVEAGNVAIAGGAWNSGHLEIGAYHLWVDATGDLRIKSGAPTSDTDGTVVGAQT